MEKSDKVTYEEALNNYYKLKNDYEKKYYTKKIKIINNDLLSIKDKKKEISNIKQKCINCNKDGGTVFKYENKKLIALCGHKTSPCNLNISLSKHKILDIRNLLYDLENKIDELKTNIIKVKLDFLFNYNNQQISLELFNKFKKELEEINVKYSDLILNYTSITNNLDLKHEIDNNLLSQHELLEKIKIINNEYITTKSIYYINDLVELYINEFIKINNNILNLKYKYNNVEKIISHSDIYKLNQYKNNFDEFEVTIENPKVDSYKK